MRKFRQRIRSTAPRRRQPTQAQIDASQRAWDEALGSIEGHYVQGQVVIDHYGQAWRTTRPGRRYHEDVDTRLYPVLPCRLPAAPAAARRLEAVLEELLLRPAEPQPSLSADRITWRVPREPGRDAFWAPTLDVDGDVVYAHRPVYDDVPRTGWVRDARLAARVRADIATATSAPSYVALADVKPRGEYAAAIAIGEALQSLAPSEVA